MRGDIKAVMELRALTFTLSDPTVRREIARGWSCT